MAASKGLLVQVFFPFSTTPQTPALVRVSADASVSEVVEKALGKFAATMFMIGAEDTLGAVPSRVLSDYLVRLARGDGTADRTVSPLRFEATLLTQGVSFPYMLHIAIDPTKDVAGLSLTDAYRDQLLSESPYGGSTGRKAGGPDSDRVREAVTQRQAAVDKLERERKSREDQRIRDSVLRQRDLETRVAAEKEAENQRLIAEMQARQQQMQERNMRLMLQEEEERKLQAAEARVLAAQRADSDERKEAVEAARQQRMEEEEETQKALEQEMTAVRAATASERHQQALNGIIGRLHEEITRDEELRLANEMQETRLEDMVNRQLHEMSVLDRARRDRSSRSSASNERRAKREQSLQETADSYARAVASSTRRIQEMEEAARDAVAPRFALLEERAFLEQEYLNSLRRTSQSE